MLAVELVPTADDAFYEANDLGILEQLWSGALLTNNFGEDFAQR